MVEQKRVHFIGIGGIGMSALAHILLGKGICVTGSDLSSNYALDSLQEKGVRIFIGHREENVEGASAVVYSSAVPVDNPELKRAKEKGVRLLHRSELLAQLMEGYAPLLIAGTHGKTTTASLLAHVLSHAGLNPCYAIGGMVKSLKSNGGYGTGPYFVAEADESDGSFLKYPAVGAILTNVDNDHLDYWVDEQALIEGFKTFSSQISLREYFFWCMDDQRLGPLAIKGKSYGFSEGADLRIVQARQEGWNSVFSLLFRGEEYRDIEMPLIGHHNVLNAAAVFGLCISLNLSEEMLRAAFKSFCGIGRRADKKGEANSIEIYDDYAHHPTEILTTLKALKAAIKDKRLIVAFQPHRYTRTRDCLDQFPDAFMEADGVILTDIYSAGESSVVGITEETLLEKMRSNRRDPGSITYVPRAELVQFLAGFLQPNDVLVTMGAGDVTQVGPQLLDL